MTLTYVWQALRGNWVACRSGLWCFGETPDAAAAELGRRYIDGPRLIFFSGTKPDVGMKPSWWYADQGKPCEGFL